MSREEVLRKTGELFTLRYDYHLFTDIILCIYVWILHVVLLTGSSILFFGKTPIYILSKTFRGFPI